MYILVRLCLFMYKNYVELRVRNILFRICCTALVYINTSNKETADNNSYVLSYIQNILDSI
jgi:hypothetical protein